MAARVPARHGAHPWRRAGAVVLGCAGLFAVAPIRADEELRNWFDDPFFALTSAIPDCPLPLGPFMTEAERRVQAHHRAEKGTTCWLAKEPDCERANAYGYDREIADEIRRAAPESRAFADSSLWITVQGRVVYIEGCARAPGAELEIEAFVRALPHVQQAIAIVRTDPRARAPYRLRHPAP
jgi:hypothetical protein